MTKVFRRTISFWLLIAGLILVAGCTLDVNPDPIAGGNASVTLNWDANTEPDVKGYKLYFGLESGNYVESIDVGAATKYTVSGLQPGQTYYFALTAYNANGLESDFSAELTYSVPAEGN